MDLRPMTEDEIAKVARAGRTVTVIGIVTAILFTVPFAIMIARGFARHQPDRGVTGIVFLLLFDGIASIFLIFGAKPLKDAREGMAAVDRGTITNKTVSRGNCSVTVNGIDFNVDRGVFERVDFNEEVEIHYSPRGHFILRLTDSRGETYPSDK